MAILKRIILDTDNGIYEDSYNLNEFFVGSNGAWPVRITKHRLQGGVRDGVDIIEIDNGKFRFTVIPTRGMGLWRGQCGDTELKWNSGVHGPVNPRLVPLTDPSGLGWLEGFDEWLARCGLESNGAPEFNENGTLKYGLHGRIENQPARFLEIQYNTETGEISVTGIVEETRALIKRIHLTVKYSTFAGSTKLTVNDTIGNQATTASAFELLYHLNFGAPLATPGGKYSIPFEKMCPRNADAIEQLDVWDQLQPYIPGAPERCYLFDLAKDKNNQTRVMLANATADRAVTLTFSKNDFPYFLTWKMQRPEGDPYVAALEPCVNFPNTRSFEEKNGRVVPLEPGESKSFQFDMEVLLDADAVAKTESEIKELQKGAAGTILKQPIANWCE